MVRDDLGPWRVVSVAGMLSFREDMGLLMAMGMCVLRVSGEPQDVLVSGG